MSVNETILQAARTWIKETLGVTDSKVIAVQRGTKGPRPPLPFLSVQVFAADRPSGIDYGYVNAAGMEKRIGWRQATLRIMAYGPGSDEMIAELGLWTQNAPDPLSVIDMQNSIQDISALQGEAIEESYMKDFLLEYAITAEQAAVVVDTIDVDMTIADQAINITQDMT